MAGSLILATLPALAANTPRLSMSGQAARADQAADGYGGYSIFEIQSLGCLAAGFGTTTLAAVTGTAATMVTGGVALPFAGEIVASFVTYFAAGCAIGAIIAPGVPLIHRETVAITESAADAVAGLLQAPATNPAPVEVSKAHRVK